MNEFFWSSYEKGMIEEKCPGQNIDTGFKHFPFLLCTSNCQLFLGNNFDLNIQELKRSFDQLFDDVDDISEDEVVLHAQKVLSNILYKSPSYSDFVVEDFLSNNLKKILNNAKLLYSNDFNFKEIIVSMGCLYLGKISNGFKELEICLILFKLMTPSFTLDIDMLLAKKHLNGFSQVSNLNIKEQDENNLTLITEGYDKFTVVNKNNVFTSDIKVNQEIKLCKVSILDNTKYNGVQNKIIFNRDEFLKIDGEFLKIKFKGQNSKNSLLVGVIKSTYEPLLPIR